MSLEGSLPGAHHDSLPPKEADPLFNSELWKIIEPYLQEGFAGLEQRENDDYEFTVPGTRSGQDELVIQVKDRNDNQSSKNYKITIKIKATKNEVLLGIYLSNSKATPASKPPRRLGNSRANSSFAAVIDSLRDSKKLGSSRIENDEYEASFLIEYVPEGKNRQTIIANPILKVEPRSQGQGLGRLLAHQSHHINRLLLECYPSYFKNKSFKGVVKDTSSGKFSSRRAQEMGAQQTGAGRIKELMTRWLRGKWYYTYKE